MSGVLFVVYIPSKEVEENIRLKHAHSQSIVVVTTENDRGDGRAAVGGQDDDHTPLTTPEMQQRFASFKVSTTEFQTRLKLNSRKLIYVRCVAS